MSTDENYKQSVKIWTENQAKIIEILKLDAEYVKKEIILKQQQFELIVKSIKHEEKFLDDYLKTVEL